MTDTVQAMQSGCTNAGVGYPGHKTYMTYRTLGKLKQFVTSKSCYDNVRYI